MMFPIYLHVFLKSESRKQLHTPRKRFVGNPHIILLGQLCRLSQILHNDTHIPTTLPDITTQQQQIRPQLLHEQQLPLQPLKRPLPHRRIHQTLQVSEGLVQRYPQSEFLSELSDIGRSAIELDQVVLEDFNGIEACMSDCLEFLREGA